MYNYGFHRLLYTLKFDERFTVICNMNRHATFYYIYMFSFDKLYQWTDKQIECPDVIS
jgi:hypothetical protein